MSIEQNTITSTPSDTSAQVTYRPVTWDDIDAIATEFDKMWGFHDSGGNEADSLVVSRRQVLHYLVPATHGDVAELNGEFMGILITRIEGKPLIFPDAKHELDRCDKEIRHNGSTHANQYLDVVLHTRALEDTMEHDSGINDNTQGEVELFLVAQKARGHGVGGTLWRRAQKRFTDGDVSSFYLHTDSTCDFSFYEHQGMHCVAQHYAKDHPEDEILKDDIFIYADTIA